ncbi:MAG: hypothetical protein GXO75_15430 [Calditrichaeota bacterium]|nr:hypothetical protein [Calditrichota bacterium]
MGQGFTTRAAIAKQSAFATAVSVNCVLPFNSESIKRVRPLMDRAYLSGISGFKKPKFPIQRAEGAISGEAVYDEIATDQIGWEHIVMGALGSGAYDATNLLNRYTVADSLPSFTVALLKRSGIVWETVGAKINSLEISGSAADQILTWNADVIGGKLLVTGDSGITNTSTTFAGLTPANVPTPLLFSDLDFKLADTADALASGDKLNISEFTLTISNNLEDPKYATPDASTHTDSSMPIEPKRNGLREVTLQVTFPRYDTESWIQALASATTYQAQMTFSNGSYTFTIYLPTLVVQEPTAEVGGPEIFGQTVTFKAFYNDGQNTVMTDAASNNITGEIEIEAKTARTSVPA